MQRLLLLSLLLLGIAVCYVKSKRMATSQNKAEKIVIKSIEAERSMGKANAHTLVLPLQAFNKTMLH